MISRFNVRVYFVIENLEKGVLVSDEIIKGNHYTKFPGGGLEYGEGMIDCCLREAVEELGQEISVGDHFYTTDFFIQSQFYPSDQVISVYYTADLLESPKFRQTSRPFDFVKNEEGEEAFRWVPLKQLNPEQFHFKTDKRAVAEYLTMRGLDVS